MGAFVQMPFGDTKPQVTMPEGEYDLRIASAEMEQSKNIPGQVNILCRVTFDDNEEAAAIFHRIVGIGPEDDKDKIQNKLRMGLGFLELFGIEAQANGFDLEALAGATAEGVSVGVEEYEGQVRNRIKVPNPTEIPGQV